MNVLLTGASGFLGRRVVPLLHQRGHTVAAVDRNPRNLPLLRAHYHGDIARSDVLNDIHDPIDIVVHLAADVDACLGLDCFIDNVYGTHRLSQWAIGHGVKRVVYASTLAVYQPVEGIPPVDEQHPIRPSSLYGMTKFLGEQCLAAVTINHVCLRFTYLCGPGPNNLSLRRLIATVLNGNTPTIRDELRDYLHVDDAADAVARIVDYDGKIQVFNIGSGILTHVRSAVDLAGIASGQDTQPNICGTRTNVAADASLARAALGWKPQRSFVDAVLAEIHDVQRGATSHGHRSRATGDAAPA